MNGPNRVFDGWVGAGYGQNYCNLCTCQRGELSCRKKTCADNWNNGKQCSHTFCTFGLTAESPTEKVINIVHHHLEAHGVHHHCNYNRFVDKCMCHCWTGALDYVENSGLVTNPHAPHGAAGFFHTSIVPRHDYARPLAYENGEHWDHHHDKHDHVHEVSDKEAQKLTATAAYEKQDVKAKKAAWQKKWGEQVKAFFANTAKSEPSYAEALAEVQESAKPSEAAP